MFKTSFAAAALAALAAARGTDTGVGYDNAKTITFVTPSDDWGLTMHMYNSQAADGTNEIHGDVDLSITDGSYKVVYGFCIAPVTDPAFWDCLAIRADISPAGYGSEIQQKSYVFQDMYLPPDYDFSQGLLSARADSDWAQTEASENWKVTPQRQEKDCVPGSVPETTTCTKARGHFYRHFDTPAVDQDLQLSLNQAGDDYQVVGFYQEYADGDDWDDSLIGEKGFVQTQTVTPEVAEGETATPEQRPYLVTPVMQAYSDAIDAAVDAADQIAAQDGVAHGAKEDSIAKNDTITNERAKIDDALSTAKTATESDFIKEQLDAGQAASDAATAALTAIQANLEAAQGALDTARGLEADAQFDAVARGNAATEIGHISGDVDDITAILAALDGAPADMQAKLDEILALHTAKVAEEAAAAGGAGNVGDGGDGDDQEEEGGASAVTTFAAATLAAVYALTF